MKKLGKTSQSSLSFCLYFSIFDLITFGFSLSHLVKIINNEIINSLNLSFNSIEKTIINTLNQLKYIDKSYTSEDIINGNFDSGYDLLIQNGYNVLRSGDIIFKLKENVISYGNKGTTHGSGYTYDTHVPLIFFGKKIVQGESNVKTKITDIAPTIAKLLGLKQMSDSTGEVLGFVIKD